MFSRQNPSPQYGKLVAEYCTMHTHGDPHLGISGAAMYTGQSLLPHILPI